MEKFRAAIVDFGLGNLFSVCQACAWAGLEPCVTTSREEVQRAPLVLLPGVGAFGDAMAMLENLGLPEALRERVESNRLLVGICLGMQLLMTESHEFGRHAGLGIVPGPVVRLNPAAAAPFPPEDPSARPAKVPQVGWNRLWGRREGRAPGGGADGAHPAWAGTPLEGLPEGCFQYFVHSFHAVPADTSVWLSGTDYGGVSFCSGLRQGNVFGFQFHPERSGPSGLKIYANLARMAKISVSRT